MCQCRASVPQSGGFIVAELAPADIMNIWIYDLCWLIIIDLVKMAIIRIQDGPAVESSLAATVSRQSFHGRREGSRIFSQGGTGYAKIGESKLRLSKDIRMSISGVPMAPKSGDLV